MPIYTYYYKKRVLGDNFIYYEDFRLCSNMATLLIHQDLELKCIKNVWLY